MKLAQLLVLISLVGLTMVGVGVYLEFGLGWSLITVGAIILLDLTIWGFRR